MIGLSGLFVKTEKIISDFSIKGERHTGDTVQEQVHEGALSLRHRRADSAPGVVDGAQQVHSSDRSAI